MKDTEINMRYIELSGDYYSIGFQQGSHLKMEIKGVFDKFCRVDLDKKSKGRIEVVKETTRKFFPAVIHELQGIADGCGKSFEDIFLLNVLGIAKQENVVDRCTCLAFVAEQNGPLLGKNNDLLINEGNPMVLKKITLSGGMSLFLYSHIGTVWGGDGMNSAGLAMGLASVGSRYKMKATGLPILFLLYELLKNCGTIEELRKGLQGKETLGKGYNLLAADKKIALAVFELACPGMRIRDPEGKHIYCTNTYKHPEFAEKDGRTPAGKNNSDGRYETLAGFFSKELSLDLPLMKKILSDHTGTGPICQHCRDNLQTVASYIAMPQKGRLLALSGHPCTGKYREYFL